MIVEKYIRSLLYEHDCVVVPDFGGFIAHYISASIHPIRHTFVPPSKEIAFNEMLKLNDGLLVSYVASGEGISREEAADMVRKFTDLVKDEIWRNQKYVFEEIGTLSLNFERKLQFEPFNQINYLSESFGLPELLHKPIDRVPVMPRFRAKDRPTAAAIPSLQEQSALSDGAEPIIFHDTPKSRFRVGLVYAGIPVILGIASLTGFFWFQDNDKLISSFNPFHSYIEERAAEEDSLFDADTDISFLMPGSLKEASADSEWETSESDFTTPTASEAPVKDAASDFIASSETAKEEAKKSEKAPVRTEVEEVKEKPAKKVAKVAGVIMAANATPRYYIIVGGFGVKENAFKLVKQLANKGYREATVLQPEGKGLHKVSAGDYDNAEAAAVKAAELKAEYSSAWVFKY